MVKIFLLYYFNWLIQNPQNTQFPRMLDNNNTKWDTHTHNYYWEMRDVELSKLLLLHKFLYISSLGFVLVLPHIRDPFPTQETWLEILSAGKAVFLGRFTLFLLFFIIVSHRMIIPLDIEWKFIHCSMYVIFFSPEWWFTSNKMDNLLCQQLRIYYIFFSILFPHFHHIFFTLFISLLFTLAQKQKKEPI